jgi:mRNA-degrading endonuclease RelE of RelBE toxin-antitoxin system
VRRSRATAYQIELTELAVTELKAIRAFDRRRILDQVKEQLARQPSVPTRHRKRLEAVSPGFEHVAPVWELRIGEYRVFYDVDEVKYTVYVRAVRLKQPHQTTEDITR